MVAHKTQAVVNEQGQVLISSVPFRPGDRLDVILTEQPSHPSTAATRFPLSGPYRFDDPFSPVGVEDWDALK